MAALAAQRVSTAGTAPTYAAASGGGDTAPIGSGLVLHILNGGVSSVTVTVATPGTVGGLAISDAALVVPAGGSGFIPLAPIYRDPVSGRASITYSAATDLDIAVVQFT